MSVFQRTLAFAASGVLAAPLGVAVAALSGIGHRWIDILAQFTAPALAAAMVLLVLLGLARMRLPAGAAAIVVLLLLVAVWPQWAPPRGRAESGTPAVTLYSANLWVRNSDVAAIGTSISEAGADIVVLIELGDAPAERLDVILAAYPHRVTTPRIDRPGGPARSLIASRYPLTEIADRADDLHAVGAVARTPLGPVNVIGVHLTRPWPFQYQWGQITQVMALGEVVGDLTGPVVVAGDFNAVSSARIGRQVQTGIGLIPAPGWPGTWPSALPSVVGITIDQVYRSPDLALIERRLGRPTGSDHRPVVTRFSRAAEPESRSTP